MYAVALHTTLTTVKGNWAAYGHLIRRDWIETAIPAQGKGYSDDWLDGLTAWQLAGSAPNINPFKTAVRCRKGETQVSRADAYGSLGIYRRYQSADDGLSAALFSRTDFYDISFAKID